MLVVDEDHYKSAGPHLPSLHPTSSYWHNEPSPFLRHHRTTSNLPTKADVVIIGSGISGAFAAKRLLEESTLQVVMLEAREACWGATGRNGGHCQPVLFSNPLDVALFEAQNYTAIAALIHQHAIPCEWQPMPGGGCHAYFSPTYFADAKREVAALHHSRPDLSASVRVIEDQPMLHALRIPTASGAVVQRAAAKLSPYKLVAWLLEHLIRTAALNLQTNTPVLSLARSGSTDPSARWEVRTLRGTVAAAHVLVTANAYTPYLLPLFRDLIVPVRGEMAALRTPLALLEQPLAHTYVFIGTDEQERIQDDYLVQRPVEPAGDRAGELMFGGGRSRARREGVDVDSDDAIDEPVAAYLRTKLSRILDVTGPVGDASREGELVAEKEWTGIMGFSRDGYPWVGAVPGAEGVWVSAAYTGSGMPNAALASQHAASLILAAHAGEEWKDVEGEAVRKGEIPRFYTITEERMERARGLPRVGE
ncbi:hypothetical protein MMC13_005198 [Lambiella insularis]|nr:hypothetical protein [Lambiella insularis]